uniref:Transposase-associated domain-containing protein n=1 Tax=Aegilops tauschii subsp. strangulata TaxID=200361 RepID=A0A453D906_AEGTS
MTRDKSWMDRERDSVEWQTGMKDFLNFAFDGAHPDSAVPCPCRRCLYIVQTKKRDGPELFLWLPTSSISPEV